jgi:hypothetical protein
MKIRPNIQLPLLLIMVGLLDCGIWILMLLIRPENFLVSLGFLISRGLFSVLVLLLVRYYTRSESINSTVLGVLSGIFLYIGSIGGIIAICLILIKFFDQSLQTGMIHHIDQEEGEGSEVSGGDRVYIDISELLKVAPLADGMTEAQKEIRIAAVLAMEEIMEDVDATSIRNTLIESGNDPAKEVQFYAHEALKKMSDSYTEKIKRLMDIVNNQPDPGYETYKELADLYAQFADANIEHPILIKFYRQEAVKYYAHILQQYPQYRNAILQKFIPALYQNKEYARCLQYCEETRQEPELSSLSILYTARCLFNTRDMVSLKQFARQTSHSDVEAIKNFIALCESE